MRLARFASLGTESSNASYPYTVRHRRSRRNPSVSLTGEASFYSNRSAGFTSSTRATKKTRSRAGL